MIPTGLDLTGDFVSIAKMEEPLERQQPRAKIAKNVAEMFQKSQY